MITIPIWVFVLGVIASAIVAFFVLLIILAFLAWVLKRASIYRREYERYEECPEKLEGKINE